MDFDAFKKQFELFTKIDSPEKLSICENQYKSYVQQKEDDTYFEPLQSKAANSLTGVYEQNLHNIFEIERITSGEIYCLIQASFEPERLFIIQEREQDYLLILKELTGSYWETYYKNPDIKHKASNLTSVALNSTTGKQIFALLNQTINESRAPKAGRLVLDGVVYNLSKHTEEGIVTVSKHSPDETSRSGKVICMIENLASYIKNNKKEELSDAMAILEALS